MTRRSKRVESVLQGRPPKSNRARPTAGALAEIAKK